MHTTVRSMPLGVGVFLGYAFLLLGGIGVSLRWVVDQAIDQPISPIGIVWMCLLAYTIFTITLVLQRKQAGRGFALGLSSLTIPAGPFLLLGGFVGAAVVVIAIAIVLFIALTRPAVRAYLAEP